MRNEFLLGHLSTCFLRDKCKENIKSIYVCIYVCMVGWMDGWLYKWINKLCRE